MIKLTLYASIAAPCLFVLTKVITNSNYDILPLNWTPAQLNFDHIIKDFKVTDEEENNQTWQFNRWANVRRNVILLGNNDVTQIRDQSKSDGKVISREKRSLLLQKIINSTRKKINVRVLERTPKHRIVFSRGYNYLNNILGKRNKSIDPVLWETVSKRWYQWLNGLGPFSKFEEPNNHNFAKTLMNMTGYVHDKKIKTNK